MKGIRIYLIVLGVLAALSLYFLLGRRSGSMAPGERDFAVADTGAIQYVLISHEGKEANLSRSGGGWRVNGAPARKEAVRGLQVLVSRLEVLAPVSKNREEGIARAITERSTRIRIGMYDGREKAYRVRYDSLSSSTCMRMEGGRTIFRVRVRGYRRDNLEDLFQADPRYWRDNVIFHILPGDVRSVILRNEAMPDRSFQLARNQNGDFEVASGTVPETWMPADGESVAQYLGYFYDVRFERFLDPSKDTLYHKGDPDYVLSIECIDGERSGIGLYPVYHTGQGGEGQADLNRLYARIVGGDEWVLLRYIQIDPLLQDSRYFTGP